LILIIFPKSSRIWPFSTFSLLPKRGRWNGVASFLFVSLIAVPHFLMTAHPLQEQKEVLLSGEFVTLEAIYDGQQPDREVAWTTFPETTLSFGGVQYDVPGSLHGSFTLLPNIRNDLDSGHKYRLMLSEDVIIQIEEMPQ
ncbi:MAG: hypothetical protein AAGK66_08215, partial [Pseudomonadota bacterium]